MDIAYECDCEVVDDPEPVCVKHQELLHKHVKALEAERASLIDLGQKTQTKLIEVCRERDSIRLAADGLAGALKQINKTGLDRSLGQIVGSEHYEKAWLDCVELAGRALTAYAAIAGSK